MSFTVGPVRSPQPNPLSPANPFPGSQFVSSQQAGQAVNYSGYGRPATTLTNAAMTNAVPMVSSAPVYTNTQYVQQVPAVGRRQAVRHIPVHSEYGQQISEMLQGPETEYLEFKEEEPQIPYVPIGPLAQMGGKPRDTDIPTDWHGRQVGVHEISWKEYLDKHEVGVFSRHHQSLDNKQHHFEDTLAPPMHGGSQHHRHHLHKPAPRNPHWDQFARAALVIFPP